MHPKHKRIFLLVAFLVLVSLACNIPVSGLAPDPSPTPAPSLVGAWESHVGSTLIRFTFESDGTFVMSMEAVPVGQGTYLLNVSAAPMALDLVYDDGTTLLTILEFLDANTLRMENVNDLAPRPTAFSDYVTFSRAAP